jgi:predicted HTH domain antitoxin
MATVRFDVPDDLLETLKSSPEAAAREIRIAAALHWCSRGEMSTGKAARLAGLVYAEFLDEAARRNVDLYQYDPADIKEEIERQIPEGVDTDAIKQDVERAQSRRG